MIWLNYNLPKKLLREAMKPKGTVMSTVSLGDWPKGTIFQFVIKKPSSSSDSPVYDELATIEVEEGDTESVVLSISK